MFDKFILGCMKLTGEAFKDINYSTNERNQVTLLGIANWHTVRGKEYLLNDSQNESQTKEYDLTTGKNSPDEISDHINPNHSHFVLVDTGRINEFGEEIKFRARIEKTLALYRGEKIHSNTHTIAKTIRPNSLHSNLSTIMFEAISKSEMKLHERANFHMSMEKMRAQKNHLPAVLLVIGGGVYTLMHIIETLKNGICCVFFEVRK